MIIFVDVNEIHVEIMLFDVIWYEKKTVWIKCNIYRMDVVLFF